MSIWEKSIEIGEFDTLEGDIKADVLIIGGGMCGILCAYMLKKAGMSCVIAEADRILAKVTGSTTAKVTLQHGLLYNKIAQKYGTENAYLYFASQKKALDEIKKIASGIDCDFKDCNSFVYSLDDCECVKKEAEMLNKIGCDAEFCNETELPFEIAGAVKVKGQGQFNPLKFACGLIKDLKIYENTRITEVNPGVAITDKGKIYAKKIIVATHFPFINKHGSYFLKMYQHRSYVLALKNAETVSDMHVDENMYGLSFRSYGDLLLLGGGSHRTGKRGGGWRELEEFAKKVYPGCEVVDRWATQDCMTLDGIPYIGRYSATTSDLYVATGFNKWGMTSSMVSAMILTDMICGRKNISSRVYSPQRSMFHPQLALNLLESAKGLLTPTVPRCPHMGCALKYNKQEHSWDCPCHGSRFEESGKIINNPANDDK